MKPTFSYEEIARGKTWIAFAHFQATELNTGLETSWCELLRVLLMGDSLDGATV